MKPSIQTLGQILYSPSQYVIPVFQRNYRWDHPQWEKLWNSLVDVQSANKIGNHFMGFLVFVPGLAQPGQHTRFHLVDGQQRLTTTSILLIALRNVAKECGQHELAAEITDDYLLHPRKKGDEHFRLLPKARDKDNYISIVNGQSDATGRMSDALGYFEGRLTAEAESGLSRLRQLFDLVCQRLEFMCATLEAENAYNIFKSLNSTGVPLGPSDLIRNFVFMHVTPDDQDEFDKEYWAPLEERFSSEVGKLNEDSFSRFFRDFLMMDGRYVQPKNTFPTFESRYEATGFSPKELAKTLLANSGRYAVISSKEEDQDQGVTTALAGLNALESSTAYPLLLALFAARASGKMDSSQLANCIAMLRGFILRRFICSDSSRGYGQVFVRAIAPDSSNSMQALKLYLLERGWPDDARFVASFCTFPLYQRGYTKVVLETLERSRGHKEPADLAAAQVEHVMPQTLNQHWRTALGTEFKRIHSDWLHRPGNLTLSAYNPELWNHAFDVKRAGYEDSNIVITRELGNLTSWGEAEIKARGEMLAQEAAKIWDGPKEPYLTPANGSAGNTEDATAQRLRFWTGLVDFLSDDFADHLPAFGVRPSRSLRLQSGIRHIGFELRYMVRPPEVALDVYFWREASFSVWDRLQANPAEVNTLIGTTWNFGRTEDDGLRWMNVKLALTSGDENEWPIAYSWFEEKLALLYSNIAPKLRDEMTTTVAPTPN